MFKVGELVVDHNRPMGKRIAYVAQAGEVSEAGQLVNVHYFSDGACIQVDAESLERYY